MCNGESKVCVREGRGRKSRRETEREEEKGLDTDKLILIHLPSSPSSHPTWPLPFFSGHHTDLLSIHKAFYQGSGITNRFLRHFFPER